MKRQIQSRLAVILSGLLLVVSMPATAQPMPQRFRADSGFVTLTTPEILRITVNAGGGNDTIKVRIRWMQYGTQSCSGTPSVCRHMVVSQGVTPMETIGPDDSLSLDLPGMGDGVRVV